jgi:hypothetical protein
MISQGGITAQNLLLPCRLLFISRPFAFHPFSMAASRRGTLPRGAGSGYLLRNWIPQLDTYDPYFFGAIPLPPAPCILLNE